MVLNKDPLHPSWELTDTHFVHLVFQQKVRFEEEKVQVIKPQMKDAEVSTETPDYDRSLFIRIFCPEGLQDQTQLRCTLTCNGQIYKTGILDDPEDEEVKNRISEALILFFSFSLMINTEHGHVPMLTE